MKDAFSAFLGFLVAVIIIVVSIAGAIWVWHLLTMPIGH